jgi:hypothetical protein
MRRILSASSGICRRRLTPILLKSANAGVDVRSRIDTSLFTLFAFRFERWDTERLDYSRMSIEGKRQLPPSPAI